MHDGLLSRVVCRRNVTLKIWSGGVSASSALPLSEQHIRQPLLRQLLSPMCREGHCGPEDRAVRSSSSQLPSLVVILSDPDHMVGIDNSERRHAITNHCEQGDKYIVDNIDKIRLSIIDIDPACDGKQMSR